MSRTGKFCRIFLEGYNLTTDLTNITGLGNVYDEHDVSGFTQNKNYLAGQADATIGIDGYFDDAADSTHEALKTISASQSKLVTVALGNNALPTYGDPAASMDAQEVNYTVTPPKDGIVLVNASLKDRGNNIEWGELLYDDAVTDDVTGTIVDDGASSSDGAVGYLHLTGLSAGDTIDSAGIYHSSDNFSGDTTLLIPFTLDGSAIGAERIAVSGTVNRYVRVYINVSGASISFPIAINFIRL